MAAKSQDYSKAFNEFMGAFHVDQSVFRDAFKSGAEFAEKLSGIALGAAAQTSEVAVAMSKGTLAGLGELSKAKPDAVEYFKAASDFLVAQNEAVMGHASALGEIAKRAQMDAADVVLAAGKSFSEDASAAVKKATDEVSKFAKAA